MFESLPRPICHDRFPDGAFGRIPSFAIAPICRKLTDGERRLFLYYALQADGFAPSFKEVYKKTGLLKSNASRIRKHLAEKGFIFFAIEKAEGDPRIHVRWDHIREIAQQIILEDIAEEGGGVAATPITNRDTVPAVFPEKSEDVAPTPITDKDTNRLRKPTIGEINKTMKKRYESPDEPVEGADLSESDRRFINSIENLTEDEASSIISIWSGQIPF